MKNYLKLILLLLLLSTFGNFASAKTHRIFVFDGYKTYILEDQFEYKIYVGDTIQWYSSSDAKDPHTITSTKLPVGANSFNFNVPAKTDIEFNYVVEKAGRYDYKCTLHSPPMEGFFEVEIPSGVEEIKYQTIETGPIICPNPVGDNMKITQLSPDIRYSLTIYDEMGKSIYKANVHNCEFVDINTAQYLNGPYTVHLAYCGCKPQKNGCGGAGKTLKFIKQ